MPMRPWMRSAGGLAAIVLALAGCDKEPAKEAKQPEAPAAAAPADTIRQGSYDHKDMAFGSPPLTGASRNSTPLASSAAPTFCDTIGLIELMSMTVDPFLTPSSTPLGPRTACSTSGPSGTIVMMMSVFPATSFGDDPYSAPAAATSSMPPATMSYTVTL